MATYNKFFDFVEQLGLAKHDFGAHNFKVALSNTAPAQTDTIFADIVEIGSGNGYPADGFSIANPSWTETGGIAKFEGDDITFSASGGNIGPFRYAVIYNDTQTSPVDPLVAFWDYGGTITLIDGNAFLINFDDVNGILQVQ